MSKITIGYLVLILVMTPAAFLLYGFDKRRAKKNGLRIPERVLHGISLFGGWPGALLGQQVFRHKTQKAKFQFVFWAIGCLHFGLIAFAIYWRLNSR